MKDPLLQMLAGLPSPETSVARDAAVRRRCHQILRGTGVRRPGTLEWLLAAAAAAYVITAGVEAVRVLRLL